MGSIKNVVSEPIEGHEDYHMMVRDFPGRRCIGWYPVSAVWQEQRLATAGALKVGKEGRLQSGLDASVRWAWGWQREGFLPSSFHRQSAVVRTLYLTKRSAVPPHPVRIFCLPWGGRIVNIPSLRCLEELWLPVVVTH